MSKQSQAGFSYTDAELDALDSTISKDRLHRYMNLSKGDRKKAILFYEMNNIVSESFFGVIRGLEIALRNSIHNVMRDKIGHDDWYDRLTFLQQKERDSILSAKVSISRNGKIVIPSRVVSELSMGFWCGLNSKIYDSTLWVPHLHRAFSHVRIGRKAAHKRLERIRLIRNRIAHHECILDYTLSEEFKLAIDAIRWICPTTAAWVKHTSTLASRLQDLGTLIASNMTVTTIQSAPVIPAPPATTSKTI